jgi:DNA invertase Pin-like site-specific DNA recombinase
MTDKITACYVRVSTIEQKKEGHSIEVQKKRLIDYCKYKGIVNYQIFADEGKSGGSIAKRPELRIVIEKLKESQLERIIINRLSRFCRNLKEFLEVMEIMKDKGCELISLNDNLDTSTANGRMVINIMMSIHQGEREVAAERTEEIQESLVSEGKPITRLPIGYLPVKKNIRGKIRVKKWLIDEKKAEIIKQAFNLSASGMNKKNVSKTLNLPYSSISDILNNAAYVGIQTYKEIYYVSNYPPIIDVETFIKVNPNMANIIRQTIQNKTIKVGDSQ